MTSQELADYWRDDFKPLQAAAAHINAALREDEQNADLYCRITSGNKPSSHLYFPVNNGSATNNVPALLKLQHNRSVSLPPLIQEKLKGVTRQALMGLMAPADLAWITVDHQLYLWSYAARTGFRSPSSTAGTAVTQFCSFSVPTKQCILAVGLVRPRRGVFKDHVKWCVVVTTHDEVILCALAQSEGNEWDPSVSALQLIPTNFALSTDNVRILSIVGTESGRIFLGGDGRCVQEMTYSLEETDTAAILSVEEQLNLFYDGDDGATVPEVIHEDSNDRDGKLLRISKRTWSAISGTDSGRVKEKCAKVNCTDSAPTALKAIVPDFVLRQASTLFGIGNLAGGGSITQMVVDEARGCLYALSTTGWISVLSLISSFDAKEETVNLAAEMDGVETTRLYLETVARNQGFPPTSTNKMIGLISFPGGVASAQAGVGGMDGARAILKLADSKSIDRDCVSPNDILKPISIHVVSLTESNRITLVAVTRGGLRLYLSSLPPTVITRGPDVAESQRHGARPPRNPYAPHNRLSMCHVRSPPPLSRKSQDTAADATGGIVGGVLPCIPGRLAQVNASVYIEGVYVAAVASDTSRTTGVNGGRPIPTGRYQPQQLKGDTIFAACADIVAHQVETSSILSSNSQDEPAPNAMTAIGGIAESVVLPLSSLGSKPADDTVLPGGIVWAMAVKAPKESAVMKLIMNSKTPSDSELGAEFAPAFTPSSEARTRDRSFSWSQDHSSFNGVPTSTAMVQRPPETNIKAIGKVFVDLMLSRPIRYGLTYQPPFETGKSRRHERGKNYHISKRNASAGFSNSAAEGIVQGPATLASASPSSPNAPRHPKASRLRKGLLQPCAVPLSYLATQYYSQPREVVALNSQGLHYFHFVPVLSCFANALMAAGDFVEGNGSINSIFEAYGYNEGCAMSLGLAVGGGDNYGISRDQVQKGAVNAARSRAYVPKLIPLAETGTNPFSTMITTSSDPWVPPGYEFRASALSDGVTSLFARLVRPIWHKPAVVVTEGRNVKSRWSSKTFSSPAKVEILLDETTLKEVSPHLRNLMLLMESVFSRAVDNVPGNTQQRHGGIELLNGDSSDNSYLTRALQYSSQARNEHNEMTQQLSPQQTKHRAQLIEEKNLHSLYRTISRLVQLLDLLSLLWRAQRMADLPEVEWGLLHGFTFAQLIQTSAGQDRLESLLNSLVTLSVVGRAHAPVMSAESDQLAKMFAEQCYLFFSPGSRYAYMGLQKAHEGLLQPPNSSSRASFSNQASEYLLQAAQHWHSAPLVTGRILHTKGKESYDKIATLALEFGSPVALAAQALMDLGDVRTVVAVGLSTASNFHGDRSVSGRRVDSFTIYQGGKFGWEKELYHRRRDDAQQNGSNFPGQSPAGQPSSTKAYGAEVTAQDAIETCYAIIFYHLSTLLDNKADLADQMVEACSESDNNIFLDAFFSHLLTNSHADTLLRINIAALDKWLQNREDVELLWRYYDIQKRYRDAGQLALNRANDPNARLSLKERTDWLSRSVGSFISARDDRHFGRFEMAGNIDVAKKVEDAKDALRIAKIQNRILASLNMSKQLSVTPEMHERLSTRLILVSDLYNNVAANLNMYEECLLILHACRHDDVQTIETLWKNVLCEQFLPCGTRDQAIYHFLESFVADVGLHDEIRFIRTSGQGGTLPLFESADWKEKLTQRVVAMGKELYGTGADFVVPVSFLLSNLEGLRHYVPDVISAGWTLTTLADAGIPYMKVMEAYESESQQNDRIVMGVGGVDEKRHTEKSSALLELLRHWFDNAQLNIRTTEAKNRASQELSRELASGRLLLKFDSIRASLEMIPSETSLMAKWQDLQEILRSTK